MPVVREVFQEKGPEGLAVIGYDDGWLEVTLNIWGTSGEIHLDELDRFIAMLESARSAIRERS